MAEENSNSKQAANGASAAREDDPIGQLWTRIRAHRLIQWAIAYIAFAIAFVNAEALISASYDWPAVIGRVAIGVLAVGLPVVLTLAWYHGDKGLTRFTAGETTIISLLLLLGAGGFISLIRAPEPNGALAPSNESAGRAGAAHAASAPALPVKRATANGTQRKPRIAVLPFENLSPDPNNAFFTDGMHEEILTALANSVPGLEVISRTTMDTYKDHPATVEQIAKQLGVTHVLEGSVRRAGDEIRLTLQLIDAKTDQHLWARDYNRKLTNALTLQSEVAAEVATQLSVQLGTAAKEAPPSQTNPAAYDLYLKARSARQRVILAFGPITRWLDIKAEIDKAIALDPQFVAAYIERMEVNWYLFLDNYDASDERFALAQADLATAERLAPNSPAVLAAAGQLAYAQGDPARAVSQFDAAEARGFADPDILQWKGSALAQLGRFDEALGLYQHLFALDSKNSQLAASWWEECISARRPEQAIHVADLVLAETPSSGTWQFFRASTIGWFAGKNIGLPTASPPSEEDLVNLIIRTQSDSNVAAVFDVLKGAQLYALARRFLDDARTRAGIEAIRIPAPVQFLASALGKTPISELRGVADLLLADRAELAKDGQDVLNFVGRQKATKRNGWFLEMLRAEGQLFAGDNESAIVTARQALAMQPASALASHKGLAKYKAALVYAWAGKKDVAAALLEQLSTQSPGLPPGVITRDPIFAVPLSGNTRYQALKAKLEAQMAATHLE